MRIGLRIKQRRKDLGWSAETLAEKIGVSPATVYRYESNDIANMGADKLSALSKALMVTPDYLLGEDVDRLPGGMVPVEALERVSLPLIGEVAAGEPILAEEAYETRVGVGFPARADYALTVRGNSMEPTYLDGDVIFIRAQQDVAEGQVAVVLVDDSAALKHVYHSTDGITLVSDNPAYAPMRISGREHECVRILGVVVGFQRFYTADPMKAVRKGLR